MVGKVKIKLLDNNATVPYKGSAEAAGFDLYSIEDADIEPGQRKMIRTGISIAIPNGYFGAIYARSGLACKRGLRPANCVGVVDSDYRGEVMVCLNNDSDDEQKIHKYDRIAQLIIQSYEKIEFEVVDDLDNTDRGDGGFGSSGN